MVIIIVIVIVIVIIIIIIRRLEAFDVVSLEPRGCIALCIACASRRLCDSWRAPCTSTLIIE
eukprot:6421853-Karenia_brevis.AAC.1